MDFVMDLIFTPQGVAACGAVTAAGLAVFVFWDERRKRGCLSRD